MNHHHHAEHTTELSPTGTIRRQIDALNERAHELREPDAKQGLALAQTAHDLAASERYAEGMIASLVNQSHCYSWLSNFVLALSQGLAALRLAENLAGYSGLADLFLALARAQMHLSNLNESVECGEQALSYARRVGDRLTEADSLNILGIIYYRSGKSEIAFSNYAEALALHRALNNRQGECKVLVNMAQAYSAQAEYERALTIAYSGLKIARAAQSRMLEAYMLHTLGQIYADKGVFVTALDYLEQSLPAADAVGNQYVRLVSLVAIGQVQVRNQQFAAAIPQLMETLALAEQLNSKLYIYRCHELLAAIYEAQADWSAAFKHYKLFHTIKEAVFTETGMHRLQSLEMMHQIETTRREAEIYHLRNVALEKEVAERRRLEAELLHQATTDVLTNVANRRSFLRVAYDDFIHAVQSNQPLALALIDLDHFKHINDTYGHACGDQMLIALAQTCQANIRPGDRFARFGGDEFVLLLPGTDQAQAYLVVERMYRLLTTQPVIWEGCPVALSISAGIAERQGAADTLDALLARADQALYQAKRAGRNRIELATA